MAISVIPDESEAVDAALKMAGTGDLLLIFGDDISRTWKQIIYFNRPPETVGETGEAASKPGTSPQMKLNDAQADPLARATAVSDAPELPESVMLEGMRVVRDDRGVRLASEPEEAD